LIFVTVAGLAFAQTAAKPPAATPGAAAPPSPAGTGAPPYRDPKLPIEQRVADLLGRMTIEEKVAQALSCNWEKTRLFEEKGRLFSAEKARKFIGHGIGQVTRASDKRAPREMAAFTNAIQKFLTEKTRLGIPAIVHEEALHGFVAAGATSFPQAIALGATFDVALVEEIFTVAAREMRARGAHQALAPVLDVARDPRWGRTEETYGEDPYLVSRMGVAAIRGFQGKGATGAVPLAGDRVIATAKHFAVHGQPEGGRNTAPGNFSERLLREVFLPPFQAAVLEAGVMSVMASYNEIDGIPAHANRWLLRDVLRGEWAFKGVVVADYFGIADLMKKHHVVADPATGARKALETGVDIELPEVDFYGTLADQIRRKTLAPTALDETVARVLRAKFLMGLFENATVDPEKVEIERRPADRALARKAAREAIVLLKNEKGLLPLDVNRIKSLAVIGPNAAVVRLGGYSDKPGRMVSVLDGIRARAGEKVKIVHAEGCGITTGNRGWNDDKVELPDPAQDAKLIDEATMVALSADVVILVLGQNEQVSREAYADNHLGDRDTLGLVGRQDDLVRAILKVGKPTVVVLINGSPLSVGEIARRVPAIVEGFYLGEETGSAMADILFGDVSPSGRLPITIPRHVGQVPAFYNVKPSATRPYLFAEAGPLWPFGFGLSYTTFRYDKLTVTPARIRPTGSATVSVQLTNTGKRAADEVVQLYLRDQVSSVTRPIKELRGFRRVHLGPGETRKVDLTLGPAELGLVNEAMKRVVEPGRFDVMVGGSSVDLKTARLEVTDR
jgi:beta-glucosidase